MPAPPARRHGSRAESAQRVRLADVARAAGVAPAVVSRVANDDPTLRIRPETRARVIDAIAALEYTPHHSARALSKRRSGTIGIVVPMLSSPLNDEILAGAHRSAWEHGYSVILADALLTPDVDTFCTRMVDEGRADGVVLQRNALMSDDDVRALLDGPLPSVVLNASLAGVVGTVALDDERGIRLAVEHLVDLGHEAIAHLSGAKRTDTARRRQQAFVDALETAGIEPVPAWIVEAGHDVASGQLGMRKLLQRDGVPTAVVVANVLAAFGALAEARANDVAVPDDLSIIAFHDTWFADQTTPPLTTVKMPLLELGATAVEQVIRRIEGEPAATIAVTEPAPVLRIRGSTAAPRG